MSESAGRPEPRPEMRAAPRPEIRDAAARAAELLDHGVMDAETQDKFAIDPQIIPPGWSYEWKRRAIFGKEDPAYNVALATTGWEAVPAGRHPQFMPEGWTGNTIDRDGMVLMERPQQITDMVKKRDHREAVSAVQGVEDKLSSVGPNQFDRVDGRGKATVKVGRTYQPPMAIPD